MNEAANIDELIGRAAQQHQALVERAALTTPDQVDAVLNLGTAVMLHGLLEKAQIYAAHGYLDPRLMDELAAEHERLAADLKLLEEIWRTRPDSRDLAPLAEAVLGSLRRHLERDERTLYGPLRVLNPPLGRPPRDENA